MRLDRGCDWECVTDITDINPEDCKKRFQA